MGDSAEDDDEQLDCELLSYWWRKLSVLQAITGEASIDDGMACDVIDAYEYSKGFVIAMSEFRISGVRGVFEPKSTPTPSSGGVWSDVLKLYISHSWLVYLCYQVEGGPCCNPGRASLLVFCVK